MKNKKNNKSKFLNYSAIALMIFFVSCDRDISDESVNATYANTANIYTDAPVGLTDAFFESFDPASGANTQAFGTDNAVAHSGSSSIRIDVPATNDPDGGYVGGVFRDRGNGRNLTGYDALTFWAKGSTTAKIATVGFGNDFGLSKYLVTANNIQLTTNWKKYIIPIPDPSKLTQEKGMFIFSADATSNSNNGFTFWIDDLRFEKLGNISLLYPYILNAENRTVNGYIGASQVINQLGAKYNLDNGQNQTINVAPAYFNFSSTNSSVTGPFETNSAGDTFTRVIGSTGSAVVTAQLGTTLAQGSLTINAVGAFPQSPIPTRLASKVTSIFSDAYTNVPVRHYNGFFAPYQTTQGGAGSNPFNVDIQAPFPNGSINNIINYTALNFVSMGMYETVSTVNITGRTHIHLDINVRETIIPADYIKIQIETGTGSTPTSASYTINAAALNIKDAKGWTTLDIPLSSFPGLTNIANVGQVFFISDATIANIWVDNVYFYNN